MVSPDYVTLLERVNEVNATGLALANLFIAILAVVLTAVGIFVAFFTWRNSREQKEERRRLYAEHSAQLAEQYQVLVATYEEKIKSLMGRIEGIAETAESTGNGVTNTKEQLESLVTDYQNKLDALKESNQPEGFIVQHSDGIPMVKKRHAWQTENFMNSVMSVQNAMYDVKKCPHCKNKYRVSKYDFMNGGGMFQNVCPHCDANV